MLALAAPDALVLDVLMPDVDGIEVCRRLREAGDRTPVLMLTARDAVADRVLGLDAGADDYLVKPFALEELLARLRALLRRRADDGAARCCGSPTSPRRGDLRGPARGGACSSSPAPSSSSCSCSCATRGGDHPRGAVRAGLGLRPRPRRRTPSPSTSATCGASSRRAASRG